MAKPVGLHTRYQVQAGAKDVKDEELGSPDTLYKWKFRAVAQARRLAMSDLFHWVDVFVGPAEQINSRWLWAEQPEPCWHWDSETGEQDC